MAKQFCKRCLANGHQCKAYEDADVCIFCEDHEPCPVMLRSVSLVRNPLSSSQPLLRNDAALSPSKLAKKRLARPVEVPTSQQEESEQIMTQELCSCGRPKGHAGRHRGPNSKAGIPKVQRAAAKPAAHHSSGNGRANGNGKMDVVLHVNADWLESAWNRLPSDLKAVAIAAALEA